MSITREEFLEAALNEVSAFPAIARRVEARDPTVLAQIGAQATMLAMLSAQMDVAKFEPFLKSRDGTLMADASLKGILPLGRACKLTLSLQNTSTSSSISLAALRRFVDAKGRLYETDLPVTIGAGETVNVSATQIRRRTVTETVAADTDFYSLQVPLSADELYLNTLVVRKGASEFRYAPDWFNVAPDDLAYQVEVDELRRIFVRFGKATVVGYGVRAGDEFTLDITECNGRVADLLPGDQFTLEYVYKAEEASLKATLASVQDAGAAPHTPAELRVMARYPAIYDHNAVYLGEFAALLRRYISGIRFLSVWNEQIEEAVRGANQDNINHLFVSGLVTGMDDATFQERVTSLIHRADDSYAITFVAADIKNVAVTITASVAISWDLATVESQIRALMLEQFGDGAVAVSMGMERPIKKALINRLLRENIDALRDDKAEFSVEVTLPVTPLPEHFLRVTSLSLTVNVSSEEYGTNLWNY